MQCSERIVWIDNMEIDEVIQRRQSRPLGRPLKARLPRRLEASVARTIIMIVVFSNEFFQRYAGIFASEKRA